MYAIMHSTEKCPGLERNRYLPLFAINYADTQSISAGSGAAHLKFRTPRCRIRNRAVARRLTAD